MWNLTWNTNWLPRRRLGTELIEIQLENNCNYIITIKSNYTFREEVCQGNAKIRTGVLFYGRCQFERGFEYWASCRGKAFCAAMQRHECFALHREIKQNG